MKVFGKKTITDLSELIEAVEAARKRGFAIDDEEYYEGVRCVAAPIHVGAGGRIDGSISVTGSIFSMTMERIQEELADLVLETAADISTRRLGW